MKLKQMSSANDRYFASRKSKVDRRLKQLFAGADATFDTSSLDDALTYTLLQGGKRIRPLLAIAVYELYRTDLARIIDPACALELIHTGSLMLDDLPSMDDAGHRRGVETSHVVHGESVTILASASLWVRAFDILAELEDIQIHKLVSATSRHLGRQGLVLGQYLDLFASSKVKTLEQLEKSYELKTAALFQLAVMYGAYLGGAGTADMKALDTFARHLGIAFQIRDDIIDATQELSESGKDAHKDELNHKPNYVSLLGLEDAKVKLASHIKSAQDSLDIVKKDCTFLHQMTAQLAM